MSKEFVVPCDDSCMFAKGDECDCECGGKNHQQGHRLTELQRTIVRTKAGRRISTVQPGTQAHSDALLVRKMRDELGYTQREIAQEMGWSPPTVRRMIRSLTTTEALVEAQATAEREEGAA